MERNFHIVLTEKSGVRPGEAARLLPKLRCTGKMECVKRLLKEELSGDVDVLIASCEEADAAGELAAAGHCAVLLLGEGETVEKLLPWSVANGILCAGREELEKVLPQLLAVSVRLRSLRVREYSLQRKLSDTKLVNRAKLLLMTRLQMSEAEAHRYIEKTSMDNGESRRDVALRLIRTYEE